MKAESVEKYIYNAESNGVQFILSYNMDRGMVNSSDGTPAEWFHSNFRSIIINHGYDSIWKFDSTIRPPYVIELFYKNI